MATFAEIAQGYAVEIARAAQSELRVTKLTVAESIAGRIDNLRYEETGLPLSTADKLYLVDEITRQAPQLTKAADSQSFLDLVDHLKQLVGGKDK